MFLKEEIILKPKEQKLIKVEAPYLDEISGLAIIKLLDMSTQSSETLILGPKEALGILDLRSLGYYKIYQGVLQTKLK